MGDHGAPAHGLHAPGATDNGCSSPPGSVEGSAPPWISSLVLSTALCLAVSGPDGRHARLGTGTVCVSAVLGLTFRASVASRADCVPRVGQAGGSSRNEKSSVPPYEPWGPREPPALVASQRQTDPHSRVRARGGRSRHPVSREGMQRCWFVWDHATGMCRTNNHGKGFPSRTLSKELTSR